MHSETVPESRKNAFPILAQIVRSGEKVVYDSPKEIPSGVAIRILKTNYWKPEVIQGGKN